MSDAELRRAFAGIRTFCLERQPHSSAPSAALRTFAVPLTRFDGGIVSWTDGDVLLGFERASGCAPGPVTVTVRVGDEARGVTVLRARHLPSQDGRLLPAVLECYALPLAALQFQGVRVAVDPPEAAEGVTVVLASARDEAVRTAIAVRSFNVLDYGAAAQEMLRISEGVMRRIRLDNTVINLV